MAKAKYHIGIDPDVKLSGFAVWDASSKGFFLKCYSFSDILFVMQDYPKEKTKVYVEAGWLNKSNWHLDGQMSKQRAAAIGNSVGRNHQRGMDIVEIFRDFLGYEVLEMKPTKSKLDAKQFRKITGYAGRTNQETRDAGMLVYGKG